jgi:hypothetical protein
MESPREGATASERTEVRANNVVLYRALNGKCEDLPLKSEGKTMTTPGNNKNRPQIRIVSSAL